MLNLVFMGHASDEYYPWFLMKGKRSFIFWDLSFITYTKFSEKLTFLSS